MTLKTPQLISSIAPTIITINSAWGHNNQQYQWWSMKTILSKCSSDITRAISMKSVSIYKWKAHSTWRFASRKSKFNSTASILTSKKAKLTSNHNIPSSNYNSNSNYPLSSNSSRNSNISHIPHQLHMVTLSTSTLYKTKCLNIFTIPWTPSILKWFYNSNSNHSLLGRILRISLWIN